MSGRRVEERVKSNEATKGTRGVASGRARGAHREGGTAGTRRAQHRTETPETGAPEEQGKSGTTHQVTHGTDTTHTAHTQRAPAARPVGRGTAPDLRRPSQWWRAPPPGTPFRHPHSEQCGPARAHAVGPLLGPHARTDSTRDTRDAEPWLPAPEDGRPGK